MPTGRCCLWLLVSGLLFAVSARGEEEAMKTQTAAVPTTATGKTEVVSFGAGCFWCTEAVFQRIEGVKSVKSGYQGGQVKNPTYKQVCGGDTGHAEVIRVEYDPAVVTFERLLDTFWHMHDPTSLNRQGADEGTQYRSVIFYTTDRQKQAAEQSKQAQEKAGTFGKKPIVTEITAATEFYPAEDYHQDYFNQNGSAPYCRMVILPKLKKLGMKP